MFSAQDAAPPIKSTNDGFQPAAYGCDVPSAPRRSSLKSQLQLRRRILGTNKLSHLQLAPRE
jgi:hypothetical protein